VEVQGAGAAALGPGRGAALDTDPAALLLFRRAVDAGQQELLPVWFRAAVLDRYRGRDGVRVLRTNTIGRLQTPTWSLDFGIVAADLLLQLALGDLLHRLPVSERPHWLAHLVTPPASRNFVTLQLTRGVGCIDDGALREW